MKNIRNMKIELSGHTLNVKKNNNFYALEFKSGVRVGALVDLGVATNLTVGEMWEVLQKETHIDYKPVVRQYGRWLVSEVEGDDVQLFTAKELDDIAAIEAAGYKDWWIDDLYIAETTDYFTVAKGSTVLGKIWKGTDVVDMKIAFFHGDNPIYEEWEDGCGNVLSYEGWGTGRL